jgi:transcriptional regulator with XRE-family HTH domain
MAASQQSPKIELGQDPHATIEGSEKALEVSIGREVHAFRKQQNITVAELAAATNLSIGMLSKIENGNTSPSLSTLQVISNALSVPLTAFFQQFEEQRAAVHTKAGAGVQIEREGTRAGHQYNLLGHIGGNSSGVIVEPYLITLDSESDTFKTFQHSGIETIFMIEGEVDYLHGNKIYPLKPGDTLFFDCGRTAWAGETGQTAGKVSINYQLQAEALSVAILKLRILSFWKVVLLHI